MSGINNQTLRLIQKNDPSRSYFGIGLDKINDVVLETGLAIKNNEYITDLVLKTFDEKKAAIGWYQPLFDGMAESKSLVRLTVDMDSMGENSAKSFNLFLLHPDNTINWLKIIGGLDNSYMFLLEDGLKRCKSLKTLSFCDVRCYDGWCFLESILPEMELRKLVFHNSSINEPGARAIAHGISLNSTIQVLEILGLGCSEEAMMMLIRALFRPSSTVETLSLRLNRSITDEHLHEIANLMSSNMNSCLSVLNLRCLESVTAAGWIEFSRILSTPQSGLKVLDIEHNHINDDVIVAFAAALRERNNSTMEKMVVSRGMYRITEVGWGAIKNLLCDASSINATRYSDHTLYQPYHLGSILFVEMPSSIKALLKMNKNRDKSQVARMKVIKTHFSDGKFDMEEHRALIGDENKQLPQTMHWFGRDALGHSVLYDLVRKNAHLIRNPEPEQSSKRTFSMI